MGGGLEAAAAFAVAVEGWALEDEDGFSVLLLLASVSAAFTALMDKRRAGSLPRVRGKGDKDEKGFLERVQVQLLAEKAMAIESWWRKTQIIKSSTEKTRR